MPGCKGTAGARKAGHSALEARQLPPGRPGQDADGIRRGRGVPGVPGETRPAVPSAAVPAMPNRARAPGAGQAVPGTRHRPPRHGFPARCRARPRPPRGRRSSPTRWIRRHRPPPRGTRKRSAGRQEGCGGWTSNRQDPSRPGKFRPRRIFRTGTKRSKGRRAGERTPGAAEFRSRPPHHTRRHARTALRRVPRAEASTVGRRGWAGTHPPPAPVRPPGRPKPGRHAAEPQPAPAPTNRSP